MVNPYFCYVIAFVVALLLYPLGWSALYPSLSFALLSFLFASIAVHIFLGIKFTKERLSTFTKLNASGAPSAAVWVTIFLYSLWLAEFIYEGGVPLFKILLGQPYNYRLFGIPSLHVFVVTFSSFYTVYLFHLYLSSQKRIVLVLFLINLFAAILIYSRAMFFFNASACVFLLAGRSGKISPFVICIFPLALAALFYFFGVMGTLRVSRQAGTPYDNSLFLGIGKAKKTFTESPFPREYFWAYIYMTSPLANLQTNIDTFSDQPVRLERLGEMVNNEILMDFISKRTNALFQVKREREYTIHGPFNVSTVYSRCFSYLGWTGMFIMALVIMLIPLLYIKLIAQTSPFFLTGFVILCTMYLFLAYDNTIRFTGLSFQMVYPVLLHFGCKRLPWLKNIFP